MISIGTHLRVLGFCRAGSPFPYVVFCVSMTLRVFLLDMPRLALPCLASPCLVLDVCSCTNFLNLGPCYIYFLPFFCFQGVCTIFSAPNYCYRCGNQAAIMEVDETVPKQISEALYDHCNL